MAPLENVQCYPVSFSTGPTPLQDLSNFLYIFKIAHFCCFLNGPNMGNFTLLIVLIAEHIFYHYVPYVLKNVEHFAERAWHCKKNLLKNEVLFLKIVDLFELWTFSIYVFFLKMLTF